MTFLRFLEKYKCFCFIDKPNVEKDSDGIIFSPRPTTEQPTISTEDPNKTYEQIKRAEVDYIDSLSKIFNPDIKR